MGNETTGSPRSRSKKTAGVTLAVAALAGAFTLASASGTVSGGGWEGTAVLRDVDGNKVGKVKFDGDEHGTVVKVTAAGTMPPAGRAKPGAKDVERFTTNGNLVLESAAERK